MTLTLESQLILNRLRNSVLMQCGDGADDFESKSDAGKRNTSQPKQSETEEDERLRYIEDRLRKIAEFERSYQNGAVNSRTRRPRPRGKRD